VLSQTYENVEIIVVDDTTTDLPKHASEKVKYIHIPETVWVSENRNAGIAAATGKYIAILDDDDYWLPHHLDRLILHMEIDESVGLATSNGYVVHEYNAEPIEVLFPNHTNEMEGNLFIKMLWNCFSLPSFMVVKRSVLDKTGLFKNISSEDLNLLIRISAVTNVYYDPVPTGVWYKRFDDTSASYVSQENVKNRLMILLPTIDNLSELHTIRNLTLIEKTVIYLQKYYYEGAIVGIYFMYNHKNRYKKMYSCLIRYPEFTPLTLLTPLCKCKTFRDNGEKLKQRLL
jgi:glycosyltransferase involved in cell wall biosynthesis